MMNDFTKEELGIIYCNICVNDKTKDILKKVQNMFENYGETETLKIASFCCKKCNEEWNRCECKK